MRTLDEILRLARELSAAERRRLVEALEGLDQDDVLTVDEQVQAWADWLARGPQGPIAEEDDEAAWP